MTTPDNANVFRRVIEEGFNQGNVAALDDCFSGTFEEDQYGMAPSVGGLKSAIAGLRGAVPDLTLAIDEMVSSDDKLWARMTNHGTFLGFAPTGKSFTITVIDVCRFHGGKIVEHWGVPDRFALLDQLGLLPTSR